MRIHDDIYSWDGFGGMLDLASGRCRLRIFDLARAYSDNVKLIKPLVVVVSDLPGHESNLKNVSVRSCTSHIATCVVRDFGLDPHRMVYMEYQSATTYGEKNQREIPARFDVVDFEWHDDKAMHPKWRRLDSPLLETVVELIAQTE